MKKHKNTYPWGPGPMGPHGYVFYVLFYVFLCFLWFFYRLAASVTSWQALTGHGKPWQTPAGLGRSEPLRTCTLGPSLPFPALNRASCGYSSHKRIGASVSNSLSWFS